MPLGAHGLGVQLVAGDDTEHDRRQYHGDMPRRVDEISRRAIAKLNDVAIQLGVAREVVVDALA